MKHGFFNLVGLALRAGRGAQGTARPTIAVLILFAAFAAFAGTEFPPLPPGSPIQSPRASSLASDAPMAAVAPTPAPSGLVQLRVVRYTPQISRLEFYCVTDRPLRWRLERSADLRGWTRVEEFTGTNDFAPKVPMLRDNAKLVTHQLVSPAVTQMFYRLLILP